MSGRLESGTPTRFVGLISGTSMDGIDAVVVDFAGAAPRTLAATTLEFDPGLAHELDALRQDPDHYPAARLARLDTRLGEALGKAALHVIRLAELEPADIAAIGSHGQTVLHRPDDRWPFTLQIGNPHCIAALTGIATVTDFRRGDLAIGGQGAPLAPLLHEALFHHADESRAVLNLGGIANLTLLPASGGVSGFDSGPANCLIDDWYRRHHAGRFDAQGRWAASGEIDEQWLAELMQDPYFRRRPPKSTGIEYFSAGWLDRHLPDWAHDRPADTQATLVELTARSIATALKQCADARPTRLLVCGGGVHNQYMVDRIAGRLPDISVDSSRAHGVDPDHVEAVLFAWLARERLAARPLATGAITGARQPHIAGTICAPPPSKPPH
ncbi:anhydro-N-acetylmuramic acid kinase [Wenzhouxiangella sp. AB-CW3]|uniref:anhydro-N-acetylmuramic acid kinase n=1 Tax=Wenzhouxiangella sp. AB-CW3 TaxID=2771012 RepID=UPI00168AA668|nr:anhydro-N-acetylmuramic acid kinase [Wenzhouxiangella sp. AB-CW3]QOC22702.1 anhydro-N-acetylmuramic acid kinase [Wenzhouxiangella sp. AB-CW3]